MGFEPNNGGQLILQIQVIMLKNMGLPLLCCIWLGIRDEVQTFDDSDNIKDIDLETKEIKQILKGEETESALL